MIRKIIFLVCVVFLLNNAANAADYFVKATGTVGDGLSWNTALIGTAGLQSAINSAQEGDGIHVAAGMYSFQNMGLTPVTGPDAFFRLKQGVKIYGGYPDNLTGIDLTNRNTDVINHPDLNQTILNGCWGITTQYVKNIIKGTADISGALYDGFIIQGGGTNAGIFNGGGILLDNLSAVGTEPFLNNIIIQKCNATGVGGGIAITNPTVNITLNNILIEDCSAFNGGGIAITDAAQGKLVTLSNLKIIRTGSISTTVNGGGIYISNPAAELILDKIEIINYARTGNGGGIYISNPTAKTSIDSIKVNDCRVGGGIAIIDSKAKLVLNRININNCQTVTGNDGGGILISNALSKVTLDGINITECTSGSGGGGIAIIDITDPSANVSLRNIKVEKCNAANGGGIAIINTSTVLTSSISAILATRPVIKISDTSVKNCTGGMGTYDCGGGILVNRAKVDLKDIILDANKAHWGGGISIGGHQDYPYSYGAAAFENINVTNCVTNPTDGFGGGIRIFRSEVSVMKNITATDNKAYTGGGIYINQMNENVNAPTLMMNGITLANDTAHTGFGGGMAIFSSKMKGMKDITLTNNKANTYSGGMRVENSDVPTMKSIKAIGNVAGQYGGGVDLFRCSIDEIDSLILKNNKAGSYGGGLHLDGYSNTSYIRHIKNVLAHNNIAGDRAGGITLASVNSITTPGGNSNNTTTFTNIVLTDNKARLHAGGIELTTVNNVYIYNMIATRNIAGYQQNLCNTGSGQYGGGMVCTTVKNAVLDRVTFSYNQAHHYGGGIVFTTAKGIVMRNYCVTHNRASQGGGIYNTTMTSAEDSLTIHRGVISHNIATGEVDTYSGFGGGLYNTTAKLVLYNTAIVGNYAQRRGGGMWNLATHQQEFYSCLITDNFAGSLGGGGIYNEGCNTSAGRSPIYINCTIAGNYTSGTTGGGILQSSSMVNLQNCIVYNNKRNQAGSPDSDFAVIVGAINSAANYSLIGTIEANATSFLTMANCIQTNPQFVAPANASLLSATNFVQGTGATCQERNANGSLIRNEGYYFGNYRLQSGSPCLDSGNDSYANFFGNITPRDLDLEARFQGNIDMGPFEGVGGYYEIECFGCELGECPEDDDCPPVTIWTPGTDENNWNNRYNWRPQLIPGECTTVYIPGVAPTFPYLTESTDCDQIYFMQGGELGRQDLLAYNKAHVQYNLSHQDYAPHATAESSILAVEADPDNNGRVKPIDINYHLGFSADHSKSDLVRNQWHMLSAPIQEVVSGDFAFGGHPRTFMRRFIVQTEGDYPVGQFTEPFAAENIPLIAGEGFAYWMNEYDDIPLYREYGSGDDENHEDLCAAAFGKTTREFGIKVSNGIIQLPYFHDKTLLMSRRIASHNDNATTFHYYWMNREGIPIDENKKDIHNRTDLAFKLHNASVTYPVTNPNEETDILIGNPFISTIDFVKFYEANASKLSPVYRLYDSESSSYVVYEYDPETQVETKTGDIDRYIAPLQGFFVKLKAGEIAANLVFDVDEISVIRPKTSASTLRSSVSSEKNSIRINAVNEYSSSQAVIAKKENATNAYDPDEDVYKLFSNNAGVPEVFTKVEDRPVVINFVGEEMTIIPIGIRTKATGNTMLQLTGMNGYDAKQILFIDRELEKNYDLTGTTDFEYPFRNTVAGVLNNRFFIRIIPLKTGMDEMISDYSSLINVYSSDDKIFITTAIEDPIQQVYLYNMQGVLLQSIASPGSSSATLDGNFPIGSYIVKVFTEKGTKTAKIIFK